MFTSLIDQDPHSHVLRQTPAKQAILLVRDEADLREQGGNYADRFFLGSIHSLTIHFLENAFANDLLDRDEFDFTRPENITLEKFKHVLDVAGQLELGDFLTPDDFAGDQYLEIDKAITELEAFPDKVDQLLAAVYQLRAGGYPASPTIEFEDGYTISYTPKVGNGDVVVEKEIRRTVSPTTLEAELGSRKKVALFLLKGLSALVQTAYPDQSNLAIRQDCFNLIAELSHQFGFDQNEDELARLTYELKDMFNTSQLIHRIIRFKVIVENMTSATIGWLEILLKDLEKNEDAKRLMAVLGRPLIDQLVEQEQFAGGPEHVTTWEHASGSMVEYTNDFVTGMLELLKRNEGLRIAILLASLFPTDRRSLIHDGVRREFAGETNQLVWAAFMDGEMNWGEEKPEEGDEG